MILLEYIEYIEGHKNSKGEKCPWVIKSHKDNHIISSHPTEEKAKKHLRQIEFFKHHGSIVTEAVEELSNNL